MKPFTSHRTTRRTAAVMLAVWLMALGTGFANACLVQEDHARHGHLSHPEADSTALPQAPMRDILADQYDSTSEHLEATDQDHTASEKLACQNFCAAEQSGLLKQADPASAHPDTILMSAAMWRLMPASAGRAAPLAAPDVPGWRGPPLFIRFLRLTI
jgi:hypothetical protein